MLGIKKQFIKSMIKLEVVSNVIGELQVYSAYIKKVEEEQKVYETYAQRAIMLLPGVEDISVAYDRGVITIKYDSNQLRVQELYSWLQTMVDVGIDYYEEIKAGWNTQGDEAQEVEKVWQKMKPILLNKLE